MSLQSCDFWISSRSKIPNGRPLTVVKQESNTSQALKTDNKSTGSELSPDVSNGRDSHPEPDNARTVLHNSHHLVESDYIVVRETAGKGRGLFTTNAVPANTLLFIDNPIFSHVEFAQPDENDISIICGDIIQSYNTYMTIENVGDDNGDEDEDEDNDTNQTKNDDIAQSDSSIEHPSSSHPQTPSQPWYLNPFGMYYSKPITTALHCTGCQSSLLNAAQHEYLLNKQITLHTPSSSSTPSPSTAYSMTYFNLYDIYTNILPSSPCSDNITSPITYFGLPLNQFLDTLHLYIHITDPQSNTLYQDVTPSSLSEILHTHDNTQQYTCESIAESSSSLYPSTPLPSHPILASPYYLDYATFPTTQPPLFCSLSCLNRFKCQYNIIYPQWEAFSAALQSPSTTDNSTSSPDREYSHDDILTALSSLSQSRYLTTCSPLTDTVTMFYIGLVANQWSTGIRLAHALISALCDVYTITTKQLHLLQSNNDNDTPSSSSVSSTSSSSVLWYHHTPLHTWTNVLSLYSTFTRIDYANNNDNDAYELIETFYNMISPIIQYSYLDAPISDLVPFSLVSHLCGLMAANTQTQCAHTPREAHLLLSAISPPSSSSPSPIVYERILSSHHQPLLAPITSSLYPHHAMMNHCCRNNSVVWSIHQHTAVVSHGKSETTSLNNSNIDTISSLSYAIEIATNKALSSTLPNTPLPSSVFILTLYPLPANEEISISYVTEETIDSSIYTSLLQQQQQQNTTKTIKQHKPMPKQNNNNKITHNISETNLYSIKLPVNIAQQEYIISQHIENRFGWQCKCKVCIQRLLLSKPTTKKKK